MIVKCNMPTFTAKQIANWLYKRRVSSIEEMTNISLLHRKQLNEHYYIGKKEYLYKQKSMDGAIKYLFSINNRHFIESVYIPEKARATLCVSSQIGCKMHCLFCTTGRQGFEGQLTTGDIINQIISIPESASLTNLVFMGMGEPLDNIEVLLKSLEILTANYGFAWSPKRITISTVGIIPELKRLLEETKVRLAISVHSPFHAERMSWIPIEKKYPIKKIIGLIQQYNFRFQRRVSFEYITFGRLNDDIKHASALFRLLKGIPCRVNLIKYHPQQDTVLPASDLKNMIAFRNYLNSKKIICTIRSSRGEDISAACGMLSTKKNKRNFLF
ncbi:MAG: 23S rRNA (adenine(2503)-C(2))-methyltransferase RlmN [Candidatus Azobacteroides pseudotrichonymphae]|nr:MAG: 23S rRNA (adenine(2503)-C(2))-methyltransferase RlmN [Candidatus Azobacteroides pseudotrichonymphae]